MRKIGYSAIQLHSSPSDFLLMCNGLRESNVDVCRELHTSAKDTWLRRGIIPCQRAEHDTHALKRMEINWANFTSAAHLHHPRVSECLVSGQYHRIGAVARGEATRMSHRHDHRRRSQAASIPFLIPAYDQPSSASDSDETVSRMGTSLEWSSQLLRSRFVRKNEQIL